MWPSRSEKYRELHSSRLVHWVKKSSKKRLDMEKPRR